MNEIRIMIKGKKCLSRQQNQLLFARHSEDNKSNK